jgi:hypothetical protein
MIGKVLGTDMRQRLLMLACLGGLFACDVPAVGQIPVASIADKKVGGADGDMPLFEPNLLPPTYRWIPTVPAALEPPQLANPPGAFLNMDQLQAQFVVAQEAENYQVAPDLKKQIDLLQKQVEVQERMLKLLFDRAEKQTPAGSMTEKLQEDIARLDARSKQAAQRDQELANAVDNLTEQVDASERAGPNLPPNLAQWFLPSGTSETPLSIYNALSMRYNYLPSQPGAGQFQFVEYDPIFLLQLEDRFLFEAQLEVNTGGVEPEFAQIDWMVNDSLTLVAGRFMTPIGSFNDRLHYLWINKLPDMPIFAWAVVPFDFNLDGAMARGAKYIGNSPLKMEYSFYTANGWGTPGSGTVTDFAGIQGATDQSKSLNNAIAFGGRVGIWHLPLGFNGGISYFGNRPYSAATPGANGVAVDIWDLDLNYHRGNWDFRLEAAQTFWNSQPIVGNNIVLRGMYSQIAYRPYNAANRYLQKTEAVFRYSWFEGSGYNPSAIDLTAFTYPNQAPISRNQYTFGLNYYPYPSMGLRLAYEINHELYGFNLKDNLLMTAFTWGF